MFSVSLTYTSTGALVDAGSSRGSLTATAGRATAPTRRAAATATVTGLVSNVTS
jgi:hypothetical protein